jgi:hypothetical protein
MEQPAVHFEIIGKDPGADLVVDHFTDPEGHLKYGGGHLR